MALVRSRVCGGRTCIAVRLNTCLATLECRAANLLWLAVPIAEVRFVQIATQNAAAIHSAVSATTTTSRTSASESPSKPNVVHCRLCLTELASGRSYVAQRETKLLRNSPVFVMRNRVYLHPGLFVGGLCEAWAQNW